MTTTTVSKLLGVGINAQAASLLGFTTQLAATAAGSAQADALAITASMVQVSTTAASTGVRLPAASRTDIDCVLVRNDGANTLNIYPATGEFITTTVNAAITAATGTGRLFVRVSATKWLAV